MRVVTAILAAIAATSLAAIAATSLSALDARRPIPQQQTELRKRGRQWQVLNAPPRAHWLRDEVARLAFRRLGRPCGRRR